MSAPLIITTMIIDQVGDVLRYAAAHPHTLGKLLRIMEGLEKSANDTPEHTLHIPMDYKAVYTVDVFDEVPGKEPINVRHLSVSTRPGQLPPIPAVLELLLLYDFKHGLSPINVTKIENGDIVHVFEVIEGPL